MNCKSSLSLQELQSLVQLCARAAVASRILNEIDAAEKAGLLSDTTLLELEAHTYARKSWQETPDTLGEVLQSLAYELGLHNDYLAGQV